MFIRRPALFALAMIAFSNAATAVEKLPVRYIYSKTHEDKQYGYTTLDIRNDGSYKFQIKFSNGKKFDGDHFYAYALVYAKDNSILRAYSAFAGVNGAHACAGSCERTFEWTGVFTKEELASIENVGSFHGQYNVVNDKKAIADAADLVDSLAKTIGLVLGGDYLEGAGAAVETGKAYATFDRTMNPKFPVLRPLGQGEAIQLMDLATMHHDIPVGTFARPVPLGRMIEVRDPGTGVVRGYRQEAER